MLQEINFKNTLYETFRLQESLKLWAELLVTGQPNSMENPGAL